MGSNSNLVVDRCDFRQGDVINNSYTVRKALGEGSFGVVYLVEDGRGSKYALKLLRLWEVPSEIRLPLMGRFEMEFQTGQIDCDNLVRSLAYGTVGNNPFIVMEFCPGGDLEPCLGKRHDRASRICQDILIGLNALHARGKVHRDLKPENVLFKENGKAALTDFGISGDRTHRMTQCNIFGKPNQIFGTYAYMPPEQAYRARGGATVRPTTDIFSFGVLAYQLLTGELPFGSLESHTELAEYQKRGKDGTWNRNALSRLPHANEWCRVIEGCLVPDFKQRLQSVEDVMRLLPQDAYQQQRPVPLQRAYTPQPVSRGHLLRVLQGEEYGRCYDLTQFARQGRRMLTVGRSKDNAICIKSDFSDYISRCHATLELSSDGKYWAVRDGQWRADMRQWANSSNGTFVNSAPIDANGRYLKEGDIVSMGDVTLRFENY